MQFLSAPSRSGVLRVTMCMVFREARSAYGHGVRDRSMRKTHGTTLYVLWKRERFTRAERRPTGCAMQRRRMFVPRLMLHLKTLKRQQKQGCEEMCCAVI